MYYLKGSLYHSKKTQVIERELATLSMNKYLKPLEAKWLQYADWNNCFFNLSSYESQVSLDWPNQGASYAKQIIL